MERKGGCDEKLFRQALNDNREMLERLAYFSVRDREAARDIVSNVFLKLLLRPLFHIRQTIRRLFYFLVTICLLQ